MTYASKTTVSPEKTRIEIEQTLTKFGATAFMYGTNGQRAVIQFEMQQRRYRLSLLLPESRAYRTKTLHDQALRQIWRALLLVIKAKLVAVEQHIMSLEEEFLAYMVLPTGETMAERLMPEIDQLYTSGTLPSLLPAPAGQ